MSKGNAAPGALDVEVRTAQVMVLREALQPLLDHIREQTTALNRLADAMERERNASPWISAEEAAPLLGLSTGNKNYARRISWLGRQGFLTRVKDGKPRLYWRDEVVKVAAKVATGDIAYIGQV